VPAITDLPLKGITFYAVSNALAVDYCHIGKQNARNIVDKGHIFTHSVVVTEDKKSVYEFITN
jgi:hypothetical protein